MTDTTEGSPRASKLSLQGHHPAILAVSEARAAKVQLRVADRITAFAGSMKFVYIHTVIFAIWCATGLFGKDKYPFNFLTLTVSLEAIFLSTFVMIGQNRQAEYAQMKADHDFLEEEQELRTNTEVTRAIHDLVQVIHQRVLAGQAGVLPGTQNGGAGPVSSPPSPDSP